jgi:Leu/Phe-tRNA-protein transferase
MNTMWNTIVEGVRLTASHQLVRAAERAGQWSERDARTILYREYMRVAQRLERLLPYAHECNRAVMEEEISRLRGKCQRWADEEMREIERAEEQ